MRTKDVDCVLEPFHAAVGAGQTITRQLLDAGWQRMLTGAHQAPANAETPVNELPANPMPKPYFSGSEDFLHDVRLCSVNKFAVSGTVRQSSVGGTLEAWMSL